MSQTLMSIPLGDLQRSKSNIRKTQPDADIGELAASIAAHGLLQNLTVRALGQASEDTSQKYEVVSGGRRLAALRMLAKRKRIERDTPVLCLVLDSDDATEVSLAENIARAPLHPADQFDAFSKLQAEGQSVEDIAARFGISETVVRQRLKLGTVSPKLMAVYREGDMGLDQLVAFTITDDHEAQEHVWFETPVYNRHPQSIRRALTRALVEATDRRALFIGKAAYEAAGGAIVRDLFGPEDGGYLADSLLLDRLVAEKLDAEAEKLKQEGWAWVEVLPENDYEYLSRFRHLPPDEGGLTEDEQARMAELCDRYDEIVETVGDNVPEEVSTELDGIETAIAELSAREQQWSVEAKAQCGAALALDYRGSLSITRGLAKPDERGSDDVQGQASDGKKPKAAATLSESLFEDLSAHRTAALRAALAGRSDVALTALLHTLVLPLFYGSCSAQCVDIRPVMTDLRPHADGIGESKAAMAMAEHQSHLREMLPEPDRLWPWLVEQSDNVRMELLAYCVAATVNALHVRHAAHDNGRITQDDLIADALALDMADWWEPTRDAYLSRVPKARILTAVSEAVSTQAAENIERLKKGAMAKRAEELLAGKRWLPEPLRRKAALAAAAE